MKQKNKILTFNCLQFIKRLISIKPTKFYRSMGYEIVVIGENLSKENFSNYEEDNVVVRDNIAIVGFKNSILANTFYNEYKKEGKYEVFTLEEYEKCLEETETDYINLKKCTFKECIDWQFKGTENFVVVNDGLLSTWEVDYDSVNKLVDVPLQGQFILSNNGVFMASYNKHKLIITVGQLDKIYYDFEFEYEISSVEFNQNDLYLLARTTCNCYLIDIVGELC